MAVALVTYGHGRFFASLILLTVLALQALGASSFLIRPKLALFDFYQQQFPRERVSAPVAVVAIDPPSLDADGQWPWPRDKVAALIRNILADNPAVLGLDLLMPEADRTSPGSWAKGETTLPPDLKQAITALPDHDALMADALARHPDVLAVAGQRDTEIASNGPLTPVRIVGDAEGPSRDYLIPSYTSLLRSIPALDNAAAGHGLISVDRGTDQVTRKLPLVGLVGSEFVPSLTVEMLRLATASPIISVYFSNGVLQGIGLRGLNIPTDPDGSVWLHLSPHDERRFVSASDVLHGKAPASLLSGRFVLLGVTALGLVDLPSTALGPMPGVELHAQFLENVFDGRLAQVPSWASRAELAATAIIGILLIATLPWIRLRWYPAVALVPIALLIAAGVYAWTSRTWLIDVATPIEADGLVFVSLLAGNLAESNAQRREMRRALDLQRLEAARVNGELAAAKNIQTGILPKPDSRESDPRYDLHAIMLPAREVGGDLYDFFKIDLDHLYFAIGDVSGKGVPASLFMALGKALFKSSALRGTTADIGVITAIANKEISRDNSEMMFITFFAGILDLTTGELTFCNAGHDAPFLISGREPPEQIDHAHGPPIGVIDTFPYAQRSLRLRPGDVLCLMTDGVTEAMNPEDELMGLDRVAQSLALLKGEVSPQQTVDLLKAAVARFAAGADASDDITIVAVRWNGPPALQA
jgi:serine phosphatase RsbU (regulator of sigma subunit)/CHASE2 domain-containing sensor protein